jgi:DNA-directed RNA polymerase specialized sigma24 family protein
MITLNSSPAPTVGSHPICHPLCDPPNGTDGQLMILVQQRSIDALYKLYDRYAATGMCLALRIMQDRDEAEQVLLEAFRDIWGHPSQYQSARGSFSSLFSGIILHLALDELGGRGMLPLPQAGAFSERMLPLH